MASREGSGGRRGGGVSRWVRRLARIAGWSVAAALALVAALTALWAFVPPVSTLMVGRTVTLQPVDRRWVPFEAISPRLVASVLMSEDARYCQHGGVDWDALREVIEDAEDGSPSRGASTITMQVAKNLFLWPSRSYVRKGLEIPLALWLDLALSKRRVLEIYLNIAEWGPGIFGVEAASRAAFGKPAASLTPREAALLATALPNPVRRSASRPTRGHARLAAIVMVRANDAAPWLKCLG
ncbi:monofunctional biosynthetic peptidoglycan transglycosylase [Alsobacter sp. R-9]